MENYKNLTKIGKGAQGSCFLAEHIYEPGTKYVLKKVECGDEKEANKAFQEAMALQELKHPNICGYKEFFVTWDKEEAAMFVCIVMSYYPSGDLANLLNNSRVKRESVKELILRKWIAQMMDALVFVHRKKIIHRDLKPSNIFLTRDLSISIGDFGVSTQFGEGSNSVKTRTTVGSMNWMAPEVMERPYDERSDVWSLGCIILEACTCSFLNRDEISGVLFDIKTSPQELEETLVALSKAGYSSGLIEIIRTMLTRNFPQRPTAEELLHFPYVAKCMELLENPSNQQKLQNNSEKAKMQRRGSVMSPSSDIPKTADPKRISVWLKENPQTTKTMAALEILLNLVNKNKRFSTDVRKTVLEVLDLNHANPEITQKSLEIIQQLSLTALEESDVLCQSSSIKNILLAGRANSNSQVIQKSVLTIIHAIGADEDDALLLGQVGALQDTLTTMRMHGSKNQEIMGHACHVIWTLCVVEENAKIATMENAIVDILQALELFGRTSSHVAEHSAAAIWCLSLNENVKQSDYLVERGVSLLLDALKAFPAKTAVGKSCFMALASIAGTSDEGAVRVTDPDLSGGKGRDGLKEIKTAYDPVSRDDQVTENFSLLMAELGACIHVRAELQNGKYGFDKLINGILKKFPNNEDIQDNGISFMKSVFKRRK